MLEISDKILGESASLSPSLRRRVEELSELKPNWDGEGAKPVKASVLDEMLELLRRLARHVPFREPFLAPTFDGSVQMEWHDRQRSLEIEAVSSGWSVVGSVAGKGDARLYFEAECQRSDFDRLEKFYDWFVGNEPIWPSQ